MPWTPLSGAKFEDVFGPSGAPARKVSRTRRRRPTSRLTIESLESRVTPAITANIVSSSLSSISPPDVTIGEIVRQRVVVQEPLSGTYDPTAFNVLAYLPSGLYYVADGTTDIALVSQNGIDSTLDPTGTHGLSVTGQNVNNVTPTFMLPSTSISTDPTTGALIFNTGITDAHDDGTVSDYVVIEFNALVANVASNQAAPPTSLTTNFHVSIGGITCDCLGTDTLTVEEPSITNLTKTAVVNAAGTAATYTVTFSNTGDSTAYDVQVVDNLPAGLTLDPASVQVVGGTGLVNNSTAAGLNLNFDSIAPNGAVTITYTAAIAAADQNGQPVTNIVNLDYTSLPGPNGTNPNPTGSVTPGASGSSIGERNGQDGVGGLNHYVDTASATIIVQPPAVHPDSLAGFVFVDENHSGDYDAGDLLLAGAVVNIEDASGNPVTDINGNVVGPETTGANGAFDFTNLKDGTYELVESFADAAADNLMNGNIFPGLLNGVQDTTAQVNITARTITDVVLAGGGVNGTQYRFGYCPCGVKPQTSINGFVYLDANKNGMKDPTEPGLPGVSVQLTTVTGAPVTDINGNVVGIMQTDANGFFQFTSLPVGNYEVRDLPPQPIFQGTQTLDGATTAGTVNGITRGTALVDVITNIDLVGGENSINNDFGKVLPSNVGAITLSGTVYFDANKNNVYDAGDSPIGGATVHLFRLGAITGLDEVAQMTTNNKGQYLFEIDTPGIYFVRLDNVPGLIKESAQVGTVNGRANGNEAAVDDLADIDLLDGDAGENYNFALITNSPKPPPFSKQQLLANQPGGAGGTGGTAFAATPSFANIDKSALNTKIVAVGAGAGGGPEVKVYNFTTGQFLYGFYAYSPSFTGGVRVAVADINGDGTPDIITAPGVGGGPDIKVFDGKTGNLIREFWGFAPTFRGGVFVAAGDVNGDGTPDIILGAGAGGGPEVKVLDGKTGAVLTDFYAYGASFHGGVSVAAGDFNQDGLADIVTGAGPGGGPQVNVYNSATIGAPGGLSKLTSFYAFSPTYRGGVFVAANNTGEGDVTGDGKTDLVVGSASGIGEVKVFDGTTFTAVSDIVAYDSGLSTNGVHVSVFDMNGDGKADIVAGSGGGEGAFVQVINVATDQDLEFWQAFNPAFLGGAWVASA